MKQTIVDEHLDEVEVHPPTLYQHLEEICAESAKQLLAQKHLFSDTTCPACSSSNQELAFDKHDYRYWSCVDCSTLFVSPRPTKPMLEWYLLESAAADFRKDRSYLAEMKQRIRELAAYRSEWIAGLCERLNMNGPGPVVDVETRTPDYLMELQRRHIEPLITVNPFSLLRDSATPSGGTWATANSLSDLGEPVRLITAFDILEHQHSISDLALTAYDALAPGGLLIITTRSGSGFDIQVLWEHAAVFPLEHINLVSLEGINGLLKRVGFEVLEASTPGQLDVQMVERILRDQKEVKIPRFLKYFLTNRDLHAKRKLQQFIQENRLSSHLRVVAKKKAGSAT